MKEYEIEPRGNPPQDLRLTGRDGPPGLHMQIYGAQAWLAINTPVQCTIGTVHKRRQRISHGQLQFWVPKS